MRRPVTLCTSQWIDLPLEVLAKKASQWGFDGLELDCRGNDFEDAGMDREWGAQDALALVRRIDFPPSTLRWSGRLESQ